MQNPITYIKQHLLGQKPSKYKLVPTSLTIVQKLDFSRAVKNPDGTTTLSLTDTHPSLTQLKLNDRKFEEPEFVEWLIKKGHIQMLWQAIFPNKDLPLVYGTEIKKPFTVSGVKPGDIDIFAMQSPDTAIGVECKIIKYDFDKHINNPYDLKRAFNKLNKIDDAWEQLEGYRKLGFHKTYLLLIVLDDQSGNKTPGQLSRKIDSKLVTQLKNLQPKNDSGIIIFYVSQITEYELEVQNMVSMDLVRDATPQLQSDSLTKMIIDNNHLFKKSVKL
jgi:hypothetical protein|tara:strand:+ start:41724 stop:42545 length:822 start_codon:yes stop_codon:yes gene_type:complete